jgi:hypothetical protein
MNRLRYEIETVIAFAEEQGDDFKMAPVTKLIDLVLHRFGNEALLRAVTTLYRLGVRSPEELAKLIPDSKVSNSPYLKALAQKAGWLVQAKQMIWQMKQLGVIRAKGMKKAFRATYSFLNHVNSEKHAQAFALRYILGTNGFKMGIISNSEITGALKYFDSAYKQEIDFDINTFAGFFRSAKSTGTELSDENYYLSPDLFNEKIERVPWIILPSGGHPFPTLVEYFKSVAQEHHKEFDEDRLERIKSLNPTAIYKGINEFDGYAVFFFNEYDGAILECPFVGNAIYLLKGEWETLSRLTKRELLEEHPREVVRIIHSGDWFSRLKELLNQSSRAGL